MSQLSNELDNHIDYGRYSFQENQTQIKEEEEKFNNNNIKIAHEIKKNLEEKEKKITKNLEEAGNSTKFKTGTFSGKKRGKISNEDKKKGITGKHTKYDKYDGKIKALTHDIHESYHFVKIHFGEYYGIESFEIFLPGGGFFQNDNKIREAFPKTMIQLYSECRPKGRKDRNTDYYEKKLNEALDMEEKDFKDNIKFISTICNKTFDEMVFLYLTENQYLSDFGLEDEEYELLPTFDEKFENNDQKTEKENKKIRDYLMNLLKNYGNKKLKEFIKKNKL